MRNGQTDLAEVARGKTGLQLGPGAATIVGTVDSGLGAAAHVCGNGAVVLPGRCVQDVGVARVDNHVCNAGPFTAAQRLFPGLTAIRGHVQTTLAALGPKRTVDRCPNRVGVFRVHDDRGYVL